jgi:hypothetical protein
VPLTKLTAEEFSDYPPQGRKLAVEHIPLLQQLPLAFLPLLLREVIAYDWKFPAEQDEIDRQLRFLAGLSAGQLAGTMQSFAKVQLSPQLEAMDWVAAPARFSEELSAYLWSTHQIDDFSRAAEAYIQQFNTAVPEAAAPTPRLGIAVISRQIASSSYPLFRKLRPRGTYYSHVDPASSYATILEAVAARAALHPTPYAHWSIEGANPTGLPSGAITSVAYDSLKPVRKQLIGKMQQVSAAHAGVEAMRTRLAETDPADVGMKSADAVLNRFAISVLSEGSGTQIYSTTFVQWTAREALRRARPLTILAKFEPRQTEESADEELSGIQEKVVLDPVGSLVDADMGAYYTWINLQRLSGADQSSFVAWFEGHGEAVAIGPGFAPGATSSANLSLADLLQKTAPRRS